MRVAIVSADPVRRAWLGEAVRGVASRVDLAADETGLAEPASMTILDLAPDEPAGLGDDPAALAAIATRCRRWRALHGGDHDVLLLVGANPDLPTAALGALLDAGADDYLALPEANAANGRALERAVLAIAHRRGRAAAAASAGGEYGRPVVEQLPCCIYVQAYRPPDEPAGTPFRFLFVSPQIEAMIGYTADEWMGTPGLPESRIHPDDAARVIAADVASDRTGDRFLAEYRMIARDGRIVWVHDEAVLIRDEAGRPLYWQGVVVDITDRKLTEQRLAEAEARYRALVEQSEGLIGSHDLDGVIRSVNPAAARALDYAPSDLIGTNLSNYLAPEDRRLFDRYLDRVRREPVVSGEARLRTRAGEERVWSFRNVRSEEPGRPVQVIAHGHDVTDRYRAEAALRASEARLRQVLASEQRKTRELDLLGQVRQALAKEFDLDKVIRTVVEGLHDTFGYGLVCLYLIENDRLRLRHQVGYPRIIEEIPLNRGVAGRVARTGQAALIPDGRNDPDFLRAFDAVASEVCVPLKVGDEVAGILSLESVEVGGLDEDDLRLMISLAEVVGVALDRARLYDALRGSEERFRTAFDSAPIGMVLLDPSLRTLRLNAAFGRMIGFDSGDIDFLDTVHPDDRATVHAALERLFGGEVAIVEMETRYLDRDGREIWGQASASVVRDDAGAPLYAILQIQDVTEGKAMAEELHHLALHDPLTGLANRVLFLDRLATAMEDPAEMESGLSPDNAGRLVAVLYLDLDGFKAVNDRFGHEAGDELLVIVAQRLEGAVRPGDVVARFGGDEFTVLLSDLDSAEPALAVANRLVDAVGQPVVLTNGRRPIVGMCAGIATGQPGTTTPGELLRTADAALYRAKAKGPNAIALFDPLLDGVSRVAS